MVKIMECQRDKFNLSGDITYLNGAYMSPQLKAVEIAGIEMLKRQNTPHLIGVEDFFDPVNKLKKAFAKLVNTQDWERIALVPSVSFGIGNIINNVKLKASEKIILMHEQFPSNVYPWIRLAEKCGAKIEMVRPPKEFYERGKIWNERILEAIDDSTAVVAMGNIHWADGTKFNLKAIREKTKLHNALLIIDGTQTVGAMPFDIDEIQPDALICSGYKWLMGTYSIGLAYYGEYFDEGIPIEEHWLNRKKSDDFAKLVDYQAEYRNGANRFSVGEQSNFILVPMLLAGVRQVLDWGVENIQNYCDQISKTCLVELKELGLKIELPEYLGRHLFGLQLTDDFDLDKLKKAFAEENVFISYRGDAVRISPNVYNDKEDFERLLKSFKSARKTKTV